MTDQDPTLPDSIGSVNTPLDFLRALYPNGPWVLSAIHPERKGIETATYGPAGLLSPRAAPATAEAFIAKHNGNWNLYYHVNPTRQPVDKKAEREDIASLNYLHVDLDARAGEDLDDEIERLEKLVSSPMQGVPEPTHIIYSGGGYQALWALQDPFQIDGEEAKFEEAKRYNIQLEVLYGGDSTHNVDRIMRLPGTWNIPGAKKKKKGRKKVEAKLVATNLDNVYPFSDFTPAPKTQTESTNTPKSAAKVIQLPQTEAEVPRIEDLEDLNEYNVPDRLKIIIAQGEHPEEPKEGDNSRSAWLFDCICNLYRCGVPDEVVYGIITDPEWKISASVLDKGSKQDCHNYAVRQMEQAKKEVAKDSIEVRWPVANDNGIPRPKEFQNVVAALRACPIDFQYNEFNGRFIIGGRVLQEFLGDELKDETMVMLREYVWRLFRYETGKDPLLDAVKLVCLENTFHPIKNYFEALPTWDGLERVGTFLEKYCGADHSELNTAIGHIIFVGAVRRIMEPGCRFDTVPVLVGKEGTNKSTLLKSLCPDADYFSDAPILSADYQRQVETLQGSWIYELAELEGMDRSDDEKLKNFISITTDRVRLAYLRTAGIYPRCCIFVGTTNREEFLRSYFGNRRWLPVKIEKTIDVESVIADRDQLWAEAVALFGQDPDLCYLPSDLYDKALELQKGAMRQDPWELAISEALYPGARNGLVNVATDGEKRIAVSSIYEDVLDMPTPQRKSASGARIKHIMERLGWSSETKNCKIEGKSRKCYTASKEWTHADWDGSVDDADKEYGPPF